jgi:hypothetical protein
MRLSSFNNVETKKTAQCQMFLIERMNVFKSKTKNESLEENERKKIKVARFLQETFR